MSALAPDSFAVLKSGLFPQLELLVDRELRPLAPKIDRDGFYPEDLLRRIGEAGAFAHHVGADGGNLHSSVEAMAIAGRHCGSTAFLIWCQDACAWYLANTKNTALRDRWLPEIATGKRIGATALSNPMKHASGIEPLKLKGHSVSGGYRVSGQLPWVSNLGHEAVVAIVFEVVGERVMALVETSATGVARKPTAQFAALEGTATFALHFDEAFISEESIIAANAGPFLRAVRPGFVLLQVGIALGLVRGALEDSRRADASLEHINQFLENRPDAIQKQLDELELRVARTSQLVAARNGESFGEVAQLRLDSALFALRATESALWHAGAKGFLSGSSPQRRVREALFVTLLTPSIKHLRKELLNGT